MPRKTLRVYLISSFTGCSVKPKYFLGVYFIVAATVTIILYLSTITGSPMITRTSVKASLLMLAGCLTLSLFTHAQATFDKVDDWLADNVSDMGGRVYLMVYKDGKIVYSNGVGEM